MYEFEIKELSYNENDLVGESKKAFGTYYENTEKIVLLLSNCITGFAQTKSWIFIGFLTQTQKSIVLSFLSTLRLHDVQSLLMIRYALESSVQAVYSIYNSSDYISYNSETDMETVLLGKKIKDRAYKWVKRNYKNYSDIIEKDKNNINHYTHANLLSAFKNITVVSPTRIESNIFDYNEKDAKNRAVHVTNRIWMIGNISLTIIKFITEAIQNYNRDNMKPYAIIKDNLQHEINVLQQQNDNLLFRLRAVTKPSSEHGK